MIHGMTGFSEKTFTSRSLRVKVSIKTLNHRFFDWSYKGSPIGEAEGRLRTRGQKIVKRGRVEVGLEMTTLNPGSWNLTINEGLLEKIMTAVNRVVRKTGHPMDISLDSLFRIPQLVELTRKGLSEGEVRFLERAFDRTLNGVLRARRREGQATAREIRAHVQRIQRSLSRVETWSRQQPARLRAKLRQRLRDLNQAGTVFKERLAEETSLLVQRYDVAEEIARLKTHLKSLRALVSPQAAGPVGKQLDFLAQELHREANTLNSKSQDIRVTTESLKIKNELESIRQHVQNLE